jgi:putative transposase
MNTPVLTDRYKYRQFPGAIISHGMWGYSRFCFGDRAVDELWLTMRGEQSYRWGVEQDGHVLDLLVQQRRDKTAAKRFFRKLLKKLTYVPRVIATDKLRSDSAVKREMLPHVEHQQHRYLNNRAENSHQPTRQRERTMRRFTSAVHAQRFLAAYGPIMTRFRPRQHGLPVCHGRREMTPRFRIWREATGIASAV